MSFDALFDGSDANELTHIYPVNDTVAHDLVGTDCWCQPALDQEHLLVIHNSRDEREAYEQGRKSQ